MGLYAWGGEGWGSGGDMGPERRFEVCEDLDFEGSGDVATRHELKAKFSAPSF